MTDNSKANNLPHGYDQPTGPFAKKHTAAEQTEADYQSFAESEAGNPEDALEREHAENASSPESNGRIRELEEQIATMKDQALRALAEAENTRRRAMKDREDAQRYAVSSFARDLLSVADNLRRALEAVPEDVSGASEQFTNLLAGVEATERELLKTFERHGIKKLEPTDEIFDPNFHEVMFEAPVPDKAPGTVIQVMEAGYILNDRLLRPARVGVAKGDASTTGPGNSIDESI